MIQKHFKKTKTEVSKTQQKFKLLRFFCALKFIVSLKMRLTSIKYPKYTCVHHRITCSLICILTYTLALG